MPSTTCPEVNTTIDSKVNVRWDHEPIHRRSVYDCRLVCKPFQSASSYGLGHFGHCYGALLRLRGPSWRGITVVEGRSFGADRRHRLKKHQDSRLRGPPLRKKATTVHLPARRGGGEMVRFLDDIREQLDCPLGVIYITPSPPYSQVTGSPQLET